MSNYRWYINRIFTTKDGWKMLVYDIENGIKNLKYWFSIIWKLYPWDTIYLIEIEEHQLKRMLNYFIKSDLAENNDMIVRDIRLCLSLIEIYKNEGENVEYVNIKNYKRFIPTLTEDHFNDKLINLTKGAIAQQKAFALYNKIRSYNMQMWWD